MELLWSFCKVAVVQTRGFHTCDLCQSVEAGIPTIALGEERMKVGSAEIRFFGDDNRIYAAPNLIYHYVDAHAYLPPPEFVSAVVHGLSPGSDEYFKRLDAAGIQ